MRDQGKRFQILYLFTTVPQILLMLLLYFLLRPLPGMVFLLLLAVIFLAVNLLIVFILRKKTLSGCPYPIRSVVLDARLLLAGHQAVIGICAPEELSPALRMSAGSSALLLTHAAAIALTEDADDPRQQAVADALRGMKVNLRTIRRSYPQVKTWMQDDLIWHVYRDGPALRACVMEDAFPVLRACTAIWEGRGTVPLTEERRTHLLQRWHDEKQEQVPPLCVATADWDGEKLVNICYLGLFQLAWPLRKDALSEVVRFRDAGVNVALSGLSNRLLLPLAEQLHCAAICPDVNPLYITSVPTGRRDELAPGDKYPFGAFSTLQRRLTQLHRWPLYLMAETALLTVGFLLGGLRPGMLVICLCNLIPQLIGMLEPVWYQPIPPLRRDMLRLLLGCGVVALAGWCCISFQRSMAGTLPGAESLFALPTVLVLGYGRIMRRMKPWAQALTIALCAAVLVLPILLYEGIPHLVPCLFMLVGGTLASLPIHLFAKPSLW